VKVSAAALQAFLGSANCLVLGLGQFPRWISPGETIGNINAADIRSYNVQEVDAASIWAFSPAL
jgi:hypothetical protein